MAKNYRYRKNNTWMVYVAIALIATVATWFFWPVEQAGTPDGPGPGLITAFNGTPSTRPSTSNVVRINRTVRTDKTATRPGAKSKPEALKKFKAGNVAFDAQKILDARRLLSEVVFAGGLSEDLADEARSKLNYLASVTIFSQAIDPRDPYTMRYRF
jgi:hypothetical protein